jgi:NADPH:quinone reductase-like Zn-dependent oxidoreductase
MMKAVVYTEYGSPDVLHVTEVAKPVPQDHEVLIKVYAASVNAADWHLLRGAPAVVRLEFGLRKPKKTILGADIAGRVEAVGRMVTQLQPGDDVFGNVSGCGWGGFAEYVCAEEQAVVRKPANVTFEQAAAVPMAAVTALQALRTKGQLQPGQKVLINGASGGVGTFAVQIAKALGADVAGVCSTEKMDLVRAIGANRVIDYTREDFTQAGPQYDLILAANGYHSLFAYKRALRPRGTYVMTGGSTGQMFQAILLGPWISLTGKQKMGNILSRPSHQDLAFIGELLESGQVVPVIDRTYPLSAVPDAIRYVEAGHAKGKVVITVEHANN